MPRCDTCGFAHAQSDHCINCGNTDPFRRYRLIKLAIAAALLLACTALGVYFVQRYLQIERSVRQAEMEATAQDDVLAPKPELP